MMSLGMARWGAGSRAFSPASQHVPPAHVTSPCSRIPRDGDRLTSFTRCSMGCSHSMFTSQWLSRKVRMVALATSAPRTRDRISPAMGGVGDWLLAVKQTGFSAIAPESLRNWDDASDACECTFLVASVGFLPASLCPPLALMTPGSCPECHPCIRPTISSVSGECKGNWATMPAPHLPGASRWSPPPATSP